MLRSRSGPGLLNSDDYAELAEAINQVEALAEQLQQEIALIRRPDVVGGVRFFTARITDSVSAGDNKWIYGWEELVKLPVPSGYEPDAWGTTGRTGHIAEGTAARNLIEYPNSDSGIQGNGVDLANVTGTFAIQPAPAEVLVSMWQEANGEYWFQYENQLDGTC